VLLIILIFLYILLRFSNFINVVELDNEVTQEDIDNYEDNSDWIIPLLDENGYKIDNVVEKILVIGNTPFAEDADSSAGMAAMLEEATGAEVINCAIAESHMACDTAADPPENPIDIYTPYYLTGLLTYKDNLYGTFLEYSEKLESEGLKPANADSVVQTLYELDPSEIDVIVYMYDFEDYWLDHTIIDTNNEYAFNTVCGNLLTSFKMIRWQYPEIRIIYMSPYYNYYINDDGEIRTCEFRSNTYGKPSTYCNLIGDMIGASGDASYVDNYTGTITEDNYESYLRDGTHLTEAGRQKLIDRLVNAIGQYSTLLTEK